MLSPVLATHDAPSGWDSEPGSLGIKPLRQHGASARYVSRSSTRSMKRIGRGVSVQARKRPMVLLRSPVHHNTGQALYRMETSVLTFPARGACRLRRQQEVVPRRVGHPVFLSALKGGVSWRFVMSDAFLISPILQTHAPCGCVVRAQSISRAYKGMLWPTVWLACRCSVHQTTWTERYTWEMNVPIGNLTWEACYATH